MTAPDPTTPAPPAPAPAGVADGYCPTCRTLTGGFYCYRCQEARDTYLSAAARRLDDRAQDAYEDGAVNKAWEYRHRADALRASIGRTAPAPAAGAGNADG